MDCADQESGKEKFASYVPDNEIKQKSISFKTLFNDDDKLNKVIFHAIVYNEYAVNFEQKN